MHSIPIHRSLRIREGKAHYAIAINPTPGTTSASSRPIFSLFSITSSHLPITAAFSSIVDITRTFVSSSAHGAHFSTRLPQQTSPFAVNSIAPPVPPKLAQRIRKGDYIQMGDLLPKSLSPALAGDQNTSKEKSKKRHPSQHRHVGRVLYHIHQH